MNPSPPAPNLSSPVHGGGAGEAGGGGRFTRLRSLCVFGFAVLLAGAAAAQDEPKGDAAAGKQLFQVKGCYSCHGYVGQGSREGPRIAPPIALPALIAQLRTPRNIMPPYEPQLVTDQQAADIYAYLASLPKPPDPKSLKPFQE